MEAQNENDITRHEWEVMLKELKKVFSIVRLLNEEELRTGRLQGSIDMAEGCECYALWNKNFVVITAFPGWPLQKKVREQNLNL